MVSIIILIITLISAYVGITSFVPDYYWFESFNFEHVLLKTFWYKTITFFGAFIPVLGLFLANDAILTRIISKANLIHEDDHSGNPIVAKIKQFVKAIFDQYSAPALGISYKIKVGLYAFLSLLIARVTSTYWNEILLLLNQHAFEFSDPIFNKNIGFYIFTFPVLSQLSSIVKFIVFILLAFSLWNYLKRGFVSLFFSKTFSLLRLHIFGLLALYFLIFSFQAYLAKFDLLFKQNDIIFGAGYTDLNIILKALTAMPMLWVLGALLAVAFIFRPNPKMLIIGAVVLFLPQFLFLKLVPSIVQNYVVTPNEFNKELPNIKRNITYTQQAYKLNEIQEVDVNYKKTLGNFNSKHLDNTINNIRLWNPGPLRSTLKQLQEIRLYYEFNDVDIDRYTINGVPQQVMISARELDVTQLSQKAQTWVNQHLMFTHGYGLCMVPVNKFTSEGLPELYIRDIPPVSQSNIVVNQPEIYFGESTNHYVIANSKQKEFDYPKDNENKYAHYQGSGGITFDSLFKRIIYAIKFKDIKLLISQNIHSKSRLMYDRNVNVIPRQITPFITYDSDPYIVVNDEGRQIWVIDGYTSSKYYPYSTPYGRQVNYIRNSVVVTIDAYSGETHFYIKDHQDPIVKSYASIYPNLFKSFNTMPNDLISHLRYPKDLFKITTKIYNTYHMNDPQVFYNKEDVWTFPTETYDSDSGITMEPYYMYLQNNDKLEYSIMMPLTPSNKNNLVAILTASCEPENFGALQIYKFPKQETVYGPQQIESRIDQNTEISKDLTLWGQVGSRVIRGNLMVIPIEDTILYAEPIYLQATQSKLPELKRVIVALGDTVSMTASIEEGIQSISKGSYDIPQKETGTQVKKTASNVTKKIIEIFSKVKVSLKNSDWKAFGSQFESLDNLIEQLKEK